ncbi:MAG TPA: hemerythrin domain-containing protein [Polyangiaceae bacterium]
MPRPPNLLNDDGSASMATALMMSHHAFRRDLARFVRALVGVAQREPAHLEALREQWKFFRNALHGHHESEDTRVFPSLAEEQPSIAPLIKKLTEDHHLIDPLLERGDRAFADLPKTDAAAAVLAELKALLDEHLAEEEAEIVPFLRGAKAFPPPANDVEAELYAQGFAWASNGIATEVLEKLDEMLPEVLRQKLPAARERFNATCESVWGAAGPASSRTPVPDFMA